MPCILLPPPVFSRGASFNDNLEQLKSKIVHVAESIKPRTISVVSNGYGTSPTASLRNAAENALKEVVGSFLSAEIQIKMKTRIDDGIALTSKIIQKDINEYSQGSIKSIRTLNISKSDSLYFAVARVEIRVEDFKRYINKIATATTTIGDNLFAQINANLSNQSSLVDSIENQLLPIIMERAQRLLSIVLN